MIEVLHKEAETLRVQTSKVLVMADFSNSFPNDKYMDEVKKVGNAKSKKLPLWELQESKKYFSKLILLLLDKKTLNFSITKKKPLIGLQNKNPNFEFGFYYSNIF